MQFMQDSKANVTNLQRSVGTSQEQTSEMVNKVSVEIEELNRCRKRDNADFTLANQTMKEQIAKVSSSSEIVAKCSEHLGSIIAVMLKSERVASALDTQENMDRTKVALMGYRDAKGSTPRPPSTKISKKSRQSTSQQPGGETSDSGEAVISVDNRCLSCSGQAQHVLSGFKMACLQYAPGPVSFSKKLYKREELLDLRHRLLEQAQDQLQHGPAGNLTDLSSNRGNLQRELEASLKRPAAQEVQAQLPERPSSQSSNGSKLRALPPLSQDAERPLTAR